MKASIQLARAILQDRAARRKWLLGTLLFAVSLVGLGTWIVDEWLSSNALLFLFYWITVFCIVCFLILFALYDALRVLKGD